MALDKQRHPRPESVITPGQFKLRSGDLPKFKLDKVDAAIAFAKFWHIEPKTQVPMKTFGPDKGELHYNDGSGSIGRLDDIIVTLIRLTNPNTGAISIQMSLEYLATSDGSRTPDGRYLPDASHETYRVNHNVYFRNTAGGLVYGWWVGQTFELNCGWNRQHCLYGKIETNILDWFDAVDHYNWDISGLFYRC